VFHGEPKEATAAAPDLRLADGLVLAPLLAAIVFVGVYPKPMLERIEPAVDKLIAHVEQHSDYREPEVAKKGPGIQAPVAAESTEEHE
jgi:NADH-quinone oxidoreductase subunit M